MKARVYSAVVCAMIAGMMFMSAESVAAQTIRFKGETCPLPVMASLPAADAVMPEAGALAQQIEAAEAERAAALAADPAAQAAAESAAAAADAAAIDPVAAAEAGLDAAPVQTAAVIENGQAILEVSAADFLGTTRNGEVIVVRTAGVTCYLWRSDAEDLLPGFDFNSLPALSADLTVGTHSDEVKVLQENLIQMGILAGTADGAYGQQTAGAVRTYQQQAGIPETGIADAYTYFMLYEAVNPQDAISMNYPPVFTADEKFASIIGTTGDVDLSAYLDKSWKFRYDSYSGTGTLGTDKVLGVESVTEPAIDRMDASAEAYLDISSDGSVTHVVPVVCLEFSGATRPYVESVAIINGDTFAELPVVSREASLEGANVKETVKAEIDEAAFAFVSGASDEAAMAIRAEGAGKEYMIMVDGLKAEFAGLSAGL